MVKETQGGWEWQLIWGCGEGGIPGWDHTSNSRARSWPNFRNATYLSIEFGAFEHTGGGRIMQYFYLLLFNLLFNLLGPGERAAWNQSRWPDAPSNFQLAYDARPNRLIQLNYLSHSRMKQYTNKELRYRWQTTLRICANDFCLGDREMVLNSASGRTR